MKLHVQNTVWLVSPPSSAKQQLEMSILKVFLQNVVVKFSLKNSDINNKGKTPTILLIERFTRGKLFLIASKEKVV